jgi:hypothetical protein
MTVTTPLPWKNYYSESRPLGSIETYFKDELRDDKTYDPLRNREDFKALLD